MTTPEELDRAREDEALRRYNLRADTRNIRELLQISRRLERENWQPPPKVDLDVLAARKLLKEQNPGYIHQIDNGDWDDGPTFPLLLSAIRQTRATERAKFAKVLDEVGVEGFAWAGAAIARIREKAGL